MEEFITFLKENNLLEYVDLNMNWFNRLPNKISFYKYNNVYFVYNTDKNSFIYATRMFNTLEEVFNNIANRLGLEYTKGIQKTL